MDREEKLAKQREYQRIWREKNRERVKASQAKYNNSEKGKASRRRVYDKYRASYPERVAESTRKHYLANREKIIDNARWRKLRSSFGLSKEDFYDLLASQGNLCAVCKTDDPYSRGGKNWCVDHCHSTGEVRGILCAHCNTALGMMMDSVKLLEELIAYLRR